MTPVMIKPVMNIQSNLVFPVTQNKSSEFIDFQFSAHNSVSHTEDPIKELVEAVRKNPKSQDN